MGILSRKFARNDGGAALSGFGTHTAGRPRFPDAPAPRAPRRYEVHTAAERMWQFLYFLPLPHGHGSLRPTFSPRLRIGSGFLSPLPAAMAASCWLRMLSAEAAAEGRMLWADSFTVAPMDQTDS